MHPQRPAPHGARDLTPEQQRNRARALVALRIVSALLAIAVTLTLVSGLRDGYVTLARGGQRGPGGDAFLLDTPLGVALGALFLEVPAVFFGIVAISPRDALRPRVLLSSIAAVAVLVPVLHFRFE